MRTGARKNLTRSPHFAISAAAVFVLLLLHGVRAQTAPTPPVCWSEAALAHRNGEERVQRGVAGAVVAPPSRRPVAFTPIAGMPRGVIRRVKLPPGEKLVAITFDLCETHSEIAGYQGSIVDYLRENNVKATFFAGGKWLLTHRERAEQLMSDPLFAVGNHTWEHRNLRKLVGASLKAEIENAQLAYEDVRAGLAAKQCLARDDATPAAEAAPPRMRYLRFPYGACNPAALDAVAQEGLISIQWDVAASDPVFGVSAEQMTRVVLASVRPGSIVIFHANGRGWHTDAAIPRIITALKAQGYEFVTIPELLSAGEPEIASSCFNLRPGDTDIYDHFLAGAEHGAAPKQNPASPAWDPWRFSPQPFGSKPNSL
ncbi:MAG TPA: polysaccharide deacetylase family protein [Xanthobacteraceae bacterium]|nr:polysaccharide deacetylase family protein [Xanthobacteraceae bacterium]